MLKQQNIIKAASGQILWFDKETWNMKHKVQLSRKHRLSEFQRSLIKWKEQHRIAAIGLIFQADIPALDTRSVADWKPKSDSKSVSPNVSVAISSINTKRIPTGYFFPGSLNDKEFWIDRCQDFQTGFSSATLRLSLSMQRKNCRIPISGIFFSWFAPIIPSLNSESHSE